MNTDTFFKKFELFADAPNAVAKMRALILSLAVQGKLVTQNHGDGSAHDLLKIIAKEKSASTHRRKNKETEISEDENCLFKIPSSWAWTELGEIALNIQYGYTASADSSLTEFRMLRITDIQNNRVDWATVPGCQIEPDEASKYLLTPNDILIARTGGTIGKSFIVPNAPVKSVFASYLIRITPPKSLLARYVKLFLESPIYWMQLREMSAGTGQPNVNGQSLGRLQMPLPPLAEQKRIVAKVDELMALCDRLEAQQQERQTKQAAVSRAALARFAEAPTPANLEFLFHPAYAIPPADLRKSILTLAVQGKLVPQNPKDEPAEKLLPRIYSEREHLISIGKLKRTKVLDGESSSATFTKPPNWIVCMLDEISIKITDGEHITPIREDSGRFLLSARNVRDDYIDVSDVDYVGDVEFERIRKRCDPNKNDVLLSCSGSVGRVAIVDADDKYVMVRSAAMIRPSKTNINSRYLALALRSPNLQEQIVRSSKQSAQANLFIEPIRRLMIPIPPLAEQKRIVARVDELMSLVDRLESQLAESQAKAEKLMEAVVAEVVATKG